MIVSNHSIAVTHTFRKQEVPKKQGQWGMKQKMRSESTSFFEVKHKNMEHQKSEI